MLHLINEENTMGETSAFHYARIAVQAEDRLLRLFDRAETAVEEPDEAQLDAAQEEECKCAG
jgi:hypothetical protein